jgi:cysteine/O-acetylserine efflux protein
MTNLYPLFIYIIVTTFTPGPNNILSMTHAMQSGYRKTLQFLVGIFTGFAIVMLICGLLNVVLMDMLPQVQFWLNLAGAGYMVYLGLHTMLSKPNGNRIDNQSMNNFKGGLMLQFLNMKVILYGVTVYALFITRLTHNFWMTFISAIALAGVGFLATSSWALGGSIFRKFWQKHYRIFNWVMGGLLIFLAVHSLIS